MKTSPLSTCVSVVPIAMWMVWTVTASAAWAQVGGHPTASFVEGSSSGVGFDYDLEEKLEWLARSQAGCDLNCEIAREQRSTTQDDSVDPLSTESTGPFAVVPLTLYFPEDSPYHTVLRQVARGDCDRALASMKPILEVCTGFTCEGGNAWALLLAEAQWCAGQRETAWQTAQALERRGYPGMELEVRALIETMAERLNRPVPPPLRPSMAIHGRDYADLLLARARRLSREGEHDAALRLLERLEQEAARPATRAAVKRLRTAVLEKAGRYAEAAALVRERWAAQRSTKAAEALEAALERLAKVSEEVAPLSRAEHLDRIVAQARRSEEPKSAIRAYAQRYALKPREIKALEQFAEGVRDESKRRRERSLERLKSALKRTQEPLLTARTLFALGRTLRRLNRDDEAMEHYITLAKDHPNSGIADEALFQAARLALYQGQMKQTQEWLSMMLEDYPSSALIPEALWLGAWSAWLERRWDKALALFTRLSQQHGQTTELSGLPLEVKALYWRSRCLSRMGLTSEAIDGFRYVVERFPMTYYAALAYHQIKAHGVDPAAALPFQPSFAEPVSTLSLREVDGFRVPAHPRAQRALELWRLGRANDAKQALWSQLHYNDPPRGVVELISTLHLQEDNVATSFWLAKRYGEFSVAPYEGNARLWGLAYPAPPEYLKIVIDVGDEVGLDPLLALAIMRHESGFRTKAVSGVGAVGLMQVMPGTADMVYRLWYDAEGPSRTTLRQPELNIRAGITLLRMMDSYFRGNLPLMVGGYNAGTGVATRWFHQFNDLETDALVEMMTYPKTVAYLKKVIGSHYAYRVLYGDGTPPPVPLKLPEDLGEWGEPEETVVGRR